MPAYVVVSPAYQRIVPLRLERAVGNLVIVDGA